MVEAGSLRAKDWLGVRLVVSVAITAVCVWIVVPFDSLAIFGDALSAAEPEFVALAAVLGLIAQTARGWRLALLLDPRGRPSFTFYRISVMHNFLASLLPARLGELSLIMMLRSRLDLPALSATGVLLGVRALDLLMVCASGGIAAWLVLPDDSLLAWLRLPAGVGGLSCLASFLILPPMGLRLSAQVRRVHARRERRLTGVLTKVLFAYSELPAWRGALLQASTVLVWLCLFSAFFSSALAITPLVTPQTAVFSSAIGLIALVSPVNGVAQIGPFEAAWTYAATAAGMTYISALAAAVVGHLVFLVIGALQFLAVIALSGRKPPSPAGPD